MKSKKVKLIVIAAVLILSAAVTQSFQANFWDNNQSKESKTAEKQNESDKNEGSGFFDQGSTPDRAAPGEGGDGQKMPITDGLWLLMGLVAVYGFSKWFIHRIRAIDVL